MNRALFKSERMDYVTPAALFAQLDREFHFTLDPCADAMNAKCAKWYGVKQDGLSQSWEEETVFMNPPYGRTIGAWIRKAAEESSGGTTVVALVPARTDTQWWHCEVVGCATEIRFIRGRVTFEGCAAAAPFPSAILVYRGRWNGEGPYSWQR